MATINEIIAVATPVERVVFICVAGALVADKERIEREIETATDEVASGRLSGGTRHADLAAELDDVNARMVAATFPFRFRALSAKAWSDLLAAHPDPKGLRIFNPDTFPTAAIAACCVDPEGLDDPVQAAKLMDTLSPAQQSDLFDGAWEVNVTSPKGKSS